uniref:uncharacterized protein LOC120822696 n=1 Tax=Gasterosteus aculeatus aculeatus TaxID=481459 RepID=UPI001A98C20D|nr:uncharacterized protein LOC120822696 [Gasterosteus aculeatus aculeatus]
MSVNSSSSFSPSNSSSINVIEFLQNCYRSPAGASSMIAFTVCSLLLVLPPCVYVVYLGLKQRRSGTAASHSDVFTFHMVAIELMNIVGNLFCCCGVLAGLPEMLVGIVFFAVHLCGQQLFHSLTCVERYLAVVHPVTYLGLKNQKGVRVRNVSIGCVWLLSFANTFALFVEKNDSNFIYHYCALTFILIAVSFCSLSVLRVLIGPGPGAGAAGRQRVDRAKMKAFYTIMVILVVLLVRAGGTVVTSVLYNSAHVGEAEKCTTWLSLTWFSLPSSLVLPLLFLHRAGKRLCTPEAVSH